jgi:hypothetical protein
MNSGMCGRWRNGRLAAVCTKAGSEECDFECPHRDDPQSDQPTPAQPHLTGRTKPGDCVHCGQEICNDLGWCNDFKAAPASDARLRPAAGGEAVALNVIRQWPEGFAARLEHVWRDLVGFIPSYKLFDLQRTLAEFGFSMVVYEGSAPTAQSGDATNAADGVQASALRELGAHLARVLDEDQWAHAEALLLKVAHGVKEQSNG